MTAYRKCPHGINIDVTKCNFCEVIEADRKTRLDDQQVGGDHYKKFKMTPWEIIDEYGLGFYSGNALKYILRANYKNGLEDLKKARHYIDKLISLKEAKGGENK